MARNFSYCLDLDDPNTIEFKGANAVGFATAEEYYSDTPLWGNQMTDVNIINNITYNCSRAIAFFGTDSGIGGMRNSVIANNTFYSTSTTTSMIYFFHESQTVVDFYNNIVRSNPDQDKFVYFDGSIAGTHHFSHNYWVYESSTPSSIVSGNGDIHGNLSSVGFLNSADFNSSSFNIGQSSPAINAGKDLPIDITFDFAGSIRKDMPDIGAYEYIDSHGSETIWSQWEQNGGKTSAAIAMESFNGKLYQAIRGNSYPYYIYIRSSVDGANWTDWDRFGVSGKTSAEVSLATYTPTEGAYAGEMRLFLAVRGNSLEIFTKSMGIDEVWEDTWNQNGGKSGAGIAMVEYDNKLYQIIRGQSSQGQLWARYSVDGVFDYDPITNPSDIYEQWTMIKGKTQNTPAVEAFGNKLVLSVRGNSDQIFNAYSEDGTFDLSETGEGFIENGGATSLSPSLAEHNGKLYQSVRGNNSAKIWNRFTTDISNPYAWDSWSEEGGATPNKISIESFDGYIYQFVRGNSGEIFGRRSNKY